MCEPGIFRFLQSLLGYEWKTCNDLLEHVLTKIVGKDARHYSQWALAGTGRYALVLSCVYRGTFARVLRLVVLRHPSPLRVIVDTGPMYRGRRPLTLVTEERFRHEIRMHELAVRRTMGASGFQVPFLYAHGILPGHKPSILIGAAVMERAQGTLFTWDDLFSTRDEELVRTHITTIHKLHRLGLTHNDLHPRNLTIHDGKPTIFDFGRAVDLSLRDKAEAKRLRVLDLLVPLWSLLRRLSSRPPDHVREGHTVLRMYLSVTEPRVRRLLGGDLDFVRPFFRLAQSNPPQIREAYECIQTLLRQRRLFR